jgi:hypothetical protein
MLETDDFLFSIYEEDDSDSVLYELQEDGPGIQMTSASEVAL